MSWRDVPSILRQRCTKDNATNAVILKAGTMMTTGVLRALSLYCVFSVQSVHETMGKVEG